jgi:hypothetical protein
MKYFFRLAVRPFPFLLLWIGLAQAQDNAPPTVQLLRATPFANEQTTISYVLYDAEDDVTGTLRYELFYYPDERLSSVDDIRTFATKLVDEKDVLLDVGQGDLSEGTAVDDVQTYTWGDAPTVLQNQAGFAPATKVLPGSYYLYLVAEDGVNAPVFTVSDFQVTVAHAPTAVEGTSWAKVKELLR